MLTICIGSMLPLAISILILYCCSLVTPESPIAVCANGTMSPIAVSLYLAVIALSTPVIIAFCKLPPGIMPAPDAFVYDAPMSLSSPLFSSNRAILPASRSAVNLVTLSKSFAALAISILFSYSNSNESIICVCCSRAIFCIATAAPDVAPVLFCLSRKASVPPTTAPTPAPIAVPSPGTKLPAAAPVAAVAAIPPPIANAPPPISPAKPWYPTFPASPVVSLEDLPIMSVALLAFCLASCINLTLIAIGSFSRFSPLGPSSSVIFAFTCIPNE